MRELTGRMAGLYRRTQGPGCGRDSIRHDGARRAGSACGLQGMAESEQFDALVALGCIIRGETYHLSWWPMKWCRRDPPDLDYQLRRSPTRS